MTRETTITFTHKDIQHLNGVLTGVAVLADALASAGDRISITVRVDSEQAEAGDPPQVGDTV